MENNSNAFKFDPNKLEKSFTDKNGTSKMKWKVMEHILICQRVLLLLIDLRLKFLPKR